MEIEIEARCASQEMEIEIEVGGRQGQTMAAPSRRGEGRLR